jgi:hypothetical protein
MVAPPANTPASNVVALPTSAEAWPFLVQQVWKTLQTALTQAWEQWAQQADDALFKRSEQQGTDANEFFEGMRLLRRSRGAMEKEFWSRLRQATDQWLTTAGRPLSPRTPGAPVTLTLVENDELEENLAVNAMADRADREGAWQWDTLRQRLQTALPLAPADAPLPFAPLAIANTFREVLAHADVGSVTVRLVLLKLFERHAWGLLNEGVTQANEHLRQSGILPQLTALAPPVARRPSSPLPGGRPEAPASVADFLDQVPHRAAAASSAMPSEATLLQALARLRPWVKQWSANQASAVAAMPPPQGVSMTPSGPVDLPVTDLLESVAALPPVPPALLRDALLAQLPAGSRQKEHEQAIDMVSIVFDFLLKDNALPIKVQALLGRLQLPYLRVAVLDPHGFAQAHHPARRLLDTLTQAGQSWSEADDAQGAQYAALHTTVERLSTAADDDLEVFVQEHDAWQSRLTRENQRQQQLEQRAVQVQEGQDRRQAAQRAVAQELTDRLRDATLSPALRGLMTQHWGPALTLMWLRHGADSTEYRRGVAILDQVRFVAQAHPDLPGLDRVRRMAANMTPVLRQGWGLLGMDEATLDKMVYTVMAFVADHLGLPPPAEPAEAARTTLPPVIQALTPETQSVFRSMEPITPLPAPAPAAQQEAVAHIQVGTWMEFEHEGAPHRGKLSWVSPFSGRWLMVSAKGLKVADVDPQDMARQLAAGTAQVLPDQTLVQRALATQSSEPAAPVPATPRRRSP